MGRKESNQTKNQMIFHEVKTKNMILRSDFLFWENYNIYHEVFWLGLGKQTNFPPYFFRKLKVMSNNEN